MGRQGGLGLVRNLCQTIADRLDYYFVDMNYVKENGNFFLRVYIDKKGGVNLEDCETFSELLSKELDEKDPIKGSYYLEVSSPGLDRPIKTDMDLERNLNREVEISLY
ncbi:MAG TPA: ribosome maturation factor RimP, partial [Tissierellaceae bacterium]|nr:ribosome maturation factor RimP [Tissierellaceae bacterium]